MILPTSYTLFSSLLDVNHEPFASGGYGDVYGGTLNGSMVCIKRVRVYTEGGSQKATKVRRQCSLPSFIITDKIQIFCKEAVVWKRLTHPNILPLLGTTITPLQLVSDWMPGGDLPSYLKKNPNADQVGLVGVLPVESPHANFRFQLSGIAEGLCYLHSCNVIHGDLKGV